MNNSKIVLFGAGRVGQHVLEFLQIQGMDDMVYAFCDNDERKIGTHISGKPVHGYNELKEKDIVFVISVKYGSTFFDEICNMLETDNREYYDSIERYEQIVLGMDPVKVNRDYCAYFHIDNMDAYFSEAESDDALKVFWAPESLFFDMFRQLDLDNVIELACGRGRHVPQYYDYANNITLVDVLEKNIEYCKKRFSNLDRIYYYQNNGFDLSKLSDNEYSALFTYDAMVHFEMFDVYSYLKETYRVLKKGGKALFHHSNIHSSYKQSFDFADNPGGRNFMSKELFGYLAYKAGFEVVDQQSIDWITPEMDCITLVSKR